MASRLVVLALAVVAALCVLESVTAKGNHTHGAPIRMSDKDFEEPAGLHEIEAQKGGDQERAIKISFKESCTFRCGAVHGECKAKGTLAKCDYPTGCKCARFFHDTA